MPAPRRRLPLIAAALAGLAVVGFCVWVETMRESTEFDDDEDDDPDLPFLPT
jgi:hypothetical protein